MPTDGNQANLVARHDRAVLAGVDAQASGRFGLALDLFEEALGLARELESRRKTHAALLNVSSCYISLGEHERARAGLPAIILESEDPRHISAAAGRLAEAFMKEGRYERAETYLKTSLESARQSEDPWREGWSLAMRGHLAVLQGRHEDAVESYAEALELHERSTETTGTDSLSGMLDNLGYAELLAGRLADGLRTLRRGLVISRRSGNVRVEAEIEKDVSFGFLLGDKPAATERHALRALRLADEHGYDTVLRNCYYVLMELSLRGDRGEDFDRYFERLQASLPGVRLSRDFFRIFDISDVINLKEF